MCRPFQEAFPKWMMPALITFKTCPDPYQYKVIVTNKTESAETVVLFHNGQGSQEFLFGTAPNDMVLSIIHAKDSIPTRFLHWYRRWHTIYLVRCRWLQIRVKHMPDLKAWLFMSFRDSMVCAFLSPWTNSGRQRRHGPDDWDFYAGKRQIRSGVLCRQKATSTVYLFSQSRLKVN